MPLVCNIFSMSVTTVSGFEVRKVRKVREVREMREMREVCTG